MLNLGPLLQEIRGWEKETFPTYGLEQTWAHLKKEIDELLAHPTDMGEVADVIMFLNAYVDLLGMDLEDVVRTKYEEVLTRTFNPPDEFGMVDHVKEDENA